MAVQLTDTITTWDLRGHHLQYFHEYSEDFDPANMLKAIRKWIKASQMTVAVQQINVRTYIDAEENGIVEGYVEYCAA